MQNQKGMPLIGITSDIQTFNDKQAYFVYKAYTDAIERFNGIPVLLTYTNYVNELVNKIDGLVITGGDFDIPPAMYGEEAIVPVKTLPQRTAFEPAVYIEALKKGIPVLGVCGGMQLINVVAGGTLYQDIKLQLKTNIDHSSGTHNVIIEKKDTILQGIIKKHNLITNTSHHQSVKEPGEGVVASARAEDGVIEAIELKDFPYVLGVQWHPERMENDMLSIYQWLVVQAQTKKGV